MIGPRLALELFAACADGSLLTPGGRIPHCRLGARRDPRTALGELEHSLGLDPGASRLVGLDWTPDEVVVLAYHGLRDAPGEIVSTPFGALLASLAAPTRARLRAAVRTGVLDAAPTWLVGGRALHAPGKAERAGTVFTWSREPVELPVAQVWGLVHDEAGRVLVMVDARGVASLPGGRPEPGESIEQTLRREAMEEAGASLGELAYLGHLRAQDPTGPAAALVRMLGPIDSLAPAAADPDTGEVYRRLLVPARAVNLWLGWGPEGDAQAAATADLLGPHRAGHPEQVAPAGRAAVPVRPPAGRPAG